jgi:hypothetical protein
MFDTPAQKDFATIALPASKALSVSWRKTYSWSAQSKTPAETAKLIKDNVNRILDECGAVTAVDYSKMDASTSSFAQEMCRDVLLLTIDPKYHERFNQGFDATVGTKARHQNIRRGKRQKKFKTGSMNTSGNSLTGPRNEILAAFVSYVANRKEGMPPRKAWDFIGPKYSDDGISPPNGSVAVAKSLGYTLTHEGEHERITAEMMARGEGPVPMLGRYYVDLLHTDASYADPARLLSSVPLIWKADVKQGLANRVYGYWATESNTPIISNYLQALMRVHKLEAPSESVMMEDRSVRWRYKRGPYPWDCSFDEMAKHQIARMIGLKPSQIQKFVDALDNAKEMSDLEEIVISRASLHKDYQDIKPEPDRVPGSSATFNWRSNAKSDGQ